MVTTEEIYNQAIKMMQNIVEDIRFGRQLYLKPFEACATQICRYLTDDLEVLTLVHNMKDKNPYMYSHPVNVALISYLIGKWLNLDDNKLFNLVCAGLLHDIGKAKVKDSILNKEEALDPNEIERIKAHPVIGYKIVNSVNLFNIQVLQGVLFHHERMDGSGYPLGLKGDKINIYSRILAIADTFDAITSTKAYRKKNSPLVALDEIQASMHKLDVSICKVFIHNLINFYNGREIRLSNEQMGNIVRINTSAISKPMVCCQNEFFDLSKDNELEVVEIY